MRTSLRRRVLWAVVAGLLVLVRPSIQAAGTATVTIADVGNGVTKYTVAWTSSAAGAVSGNAFAVKKGLLLQVKFVPGTAGTQPTDLYDVTLVDTDSVDLLNSQGANLSNSTSKRLLWDPPLFNDATQNLDVVVANAGNAKTGTVLLYVQ